MLQVRRRQVSFGTVFFLYFFIHFHFTLSIFNCFGMGLVVCMEWLLFIVGFFSCFVLSMFLFCFGSPCRPMFCLPVGHVIFAHNCKKHMFHHHLSCCSRFQSCDFVPKFSIPLS